MHRRQFLKTSTAAIAAAGVGTSPWRTARAQSGPIKIGLLAPLTGVVASGGKEMVEGVQFYLDQVKSEIAGRKVETGDRGRRFQPRHRLAESAPAGRAGQLPFLDWQLARQYRTLRSPITSRAPARPIHPDHRGGRSDPAPAHQERDPRRRLLRQRLHPSARRLGAQTRLQEDRDSQPGLHLRPRTMRRSGAGVHRRRRRNRAAVLAPAQ